MYHNPIEPTGIEKCLGEPALDLELVKNYVTSNNPIMSFSLASVSAVGLVGSTPMSPHDPPLNGIREFSVSWRHRSWIVSRSGNVKRVVETQRRPTVKMAS